MSDTDTPSTYRERREAKADRLRGWADKREAKSAALHGHADGMAAAIPFGQPILVGHYSETRDRNYRARISSAQDRAWENDSKAASMVGRADGIDSQLAGAIYSDDPDAVDALRARLAVLNAERDRVKAYNASCRKGARDVSLLTEAEQRNLVSIARVAAYSLGKGGAFPGYHLTNLSGNIARNQKRLNALLRDAS